MCVGGGGGVPSLTISCEYLAGAERRQHRSIDPVPRWEKAVVLSYRLIWKALRSDMPVTRPTAHQSVAFSGMLMSDGNSPRRCGPACAQIFPGSGGRAAQAGSRAAFPLLKLPAPQQIMQAALDGHLPGRDQVTWLPACQCMHATS